MSAMLLVIAKFMSCGGSGGPTTAAYTTLTPTPKPRPTPAGT